MSSSTFHSLSSARGSQFSLRSTGCERCSHPNHLEQAKPEQSGPSVAFSGRPSLDSDDAGTEVTYFSYRGRPGIRGFSLLRDEEEYDEHPEIESSLAGNKRKRPESASSKGKGKKESVDGQPGYSSLLPRHYVNDEQTMQNEFLPEQEPEVSPVRQVYDLPRVDQNEE